MPKLELTDEQVIELVRQLSPISKQKVLEALVKDASVAEGEPPATDTEAFTALPCFGMWSDREEMRDSADWVRKERARWQQRMEPQD